MQEKRQYKGIVQKQKIVKSEDPTLVYVSLEISESKLINAIIARNALTFLLEVEEGDEISVYGHFNRQNQFVIEKYLTHQKENINTDYPAHLKYPPKKNEH